MRLRIEVHSNRWLLRVYALAIRYACGRSVYQLFPSKCETTLASPKCASVFFARLCASKVLYIQAARAVNF